MKKAQMEYNWAFVIIAGVVILGFFVTFIVRYIDIQNMKDNYEISSNIYNVLTSLEKSMYSTEAPNITLGLETRLDISCDKLMVGNFGSASLEEKFIFSPKHFDTDEIDIWIQPWKYPFKITNLFYLSSRDKKYYILYNDKSAEFVDLLELPKNFRIEKTTTIPKKDENTRIISFTSQKADVQLTANETGAAIINGQSYPVFGMPLLYGAMFSENYPCIVDKLLKKLLIIIDIYKSKADYMYTMNKDCNYAPLKVTLSTIRDKINSKDYEGIKKYVGILNDQNNNMLSINCRPLY